MFISLICASFYAYGQKPPTYGKASAGIDIGKLIRHRTIDIEVGYAFSRHWSMAGSSSFLLHIKTRQKSEEEIMHESLLEEVKEPESSPSQGRHMACICYWTDEAFKKGFISIGYRYEEHIPIILLFFRIYHAYMERTGDEPVDRGKREYGHRI